MGFLLGTEKFWGRPRIEFSLVAATPADYDELWESPERLPLLLPTCQKVAEHTGSQVMGLFMTVDIAFGENGHQLKGLWVDATRAMKLPYIAFFGTFGHEPMGLACYFVNRFPHNALRWVSLRGKLSNEPRHNPRRVRALWHQLLPASVQP